MDDDRFDAMIAAMAAPAPRRRLLGGVVGGALAAALGRLPLPAAQAAARRGRDHCRQEKKDCERDNQCCSGICRKKKCRPAPFQGTCTIDRTFCRVGEAKSKCNGTDGCLCFQTVRGASFCAFAEDGPECATDAECVAALGSDGACTLVPCADNANDRRRCRLRCGGTVTPPAP